jgi:hypothetical protein
MIINVLGVDISLNTYTSYLAYLALLIVLTLSCSATSNTQAPSSFPLLDNRGILHEYRDSKAYPKITKPTHMSVLQVYCGVHRQWETLRIVWRRSSLTKIEHREEADYWRWTYMVSRSKKQ